MKRKLCNIIWFVAVMVFCLGVPVYGQGPEAVQEEVQPSTTTVEEVTFINPDYARILGVEEVTSREVEVDSQRAYASGISTYKSTQVAGQKYMYSKIYNRSSSVQFKVYSGSSNGSDVFWNTVKYACPASDTSDPDKGDYMRWHVYGFVSGTYERVESGKGYYHTFSGTVYYMSSAAQEAQMNSKINSVLSTLGISKMKTEYQKIRAIYDYITSHVAYDTEGLYMSTKENMFRYQYVRNTYSAYKALFEGKAVCQGYATLFYRMARQAGLSARFIGGEDHAWNIARINGRYYNLDSTWDAGVASYAYFLKNEKDFLRHTRDAEYRTSSFNSQHPMSAVSFAAGDSKAIAYRINYNLQGGKNSSKNVTSYFGNTVTLYNPTRKGYSFLGWYTNKSYTNRVYKISGTSATNYTLYARWKKVSVSKGKVSKVSSSRNGMKIAAKKISGVKGYQIAYSRTSSMKKSRTKYISITGKRTVAVKATKGKKYYVKVRGFKIDSAGKKVYGKWSSKVIYTP